MLVRLTKTLEFDVDPRFFICSDGTNMTDEQILDSIRKNEEYLERLFYNGRTKAEKVIIETKGAKQNG